MIVKLTCDSLEKAVPNKMPYARTTYSRVACVVGHMMVHNLFNDLRARLIAQYVLIMGAFLKILKMLLP